MAIPLTDYVKIKNNYCIAYLGDNQQTVDALVNNCSKLEGLYPGVHIYICIQDKLIKDLLPNLVPLSTLNKSKFAYIREIHEATEILQELVCHI